MANLKNDRRSQRTQRMLHEALMSLMQEKRYDDITVQDILDRADIGRSTFYAHYRDKEDLMTSGLMHLMEIFSQMVAEPSTQGQQRLLPTRELFEHVQENQNLFRGMVRGRGSGIVFRERAGILDPKAHHRPSSTPAHRDSSPPCRCRYSPNL